MLEADQQHLQQAQCGDRQIEPRQPKCHETEQTAKGASAKNDQRDGDQQRNMQGRYQNDDAVGAYGHEGGAREGEQTGTPHQNRQSHGDDDDDRQLAHQKQTIGGQECSERRGGKGRQ